MLYAPGDALPSLAHIADMPIFAIAPRLVVDGVWTYSAGGWRSYRMTVARHQPWRGARWMFGFCEGPTDGQIVAMPSRAGRGGVRHGVAA